MHQPTKFKQDRSVRMSFCALTNFPVPSSGDDGVAQFYRSESIKL